MSENIEKNSAIHDEVNLKEIISALQQSKILILGIISLFTASGIIYSLLTPQIWTSNALLTIAESEGASGGSGALGGLASIASLGMGEGNIEGSKALATIRSREFFKHIVAFEEVLPNLMAAKGFDQANQKTVFDSGLYDVESTSGIQGKPSTWLAYKAYRKSLQIILDSKTSFITISIEHRSPVFAQSFLALLIREINSLSRERDLEQSEASLQYLYQELESSKQADIRLAISQLIESQLKKQMLARVKSDYVLESLDAPYVPMERSRPQRKNIVLIALFIGVFTSILFVLIRFYTLKNFNKFND